MKNTQKKRIIKKLLGRIEKRGDQYVFVPASPEKPKPPIETIWFPYKTA